MAVTTDSPVGIEYQQATMLALTELIHALDVAGVKPAHAWSECPGQGVWCQSLCAAVARYHRAWLALHHGS